MQEKNMGHICPIGRSWVKLSSYIKEQLKFASFLGVEGAGGAKTAL